MTFIY